MLKLSIRITLYLFTGLFRQCTNGTLAPETSEQIYLSADRNETSQRLSSECAFRYTIANSFNGLDENSQREGIRAGFAAWQRLSRNLSFLEFSTPERATLSVKFVSPLEIQSKPVAVSAGLLRGSATVLAMLRKESNGTYSILLINTYPWNTNMLTRAVAYHAGLLLGVPTSDDPSSLMSPILQNQLVKPAQSDSVLINRLYASPCGSYLPISVQVGGPVTRTIKFDKQGTVLITASGQMVLGQYVGLSSPDGREFGLLGFPLTGYNIVPSFFHGVLMYKLNDERNWRNCGHECSFSTASYQSINLTLNINDNDLSDDIGGYNVNVQYK